MAPAKKRKSRGLKTKAGDSLEKFRPVVAYAPSPMIMADRAGTIVLANARAEELFGYAPGELGGRKIEALVPPRFRDAHPAHRGKFHEAPSERAMGAGRDLYGARKDGSEVPVEIGLNPVKTAEGDFVLASIVDITERKALEKRLSQTETLAAVGGMAAAVAHEIRNPLGSIVMGAKALARGDLRPDDLKSVMSVLVGESGRLNRTLEDFLQFARPREPKLQSGDLNATTREVLAAVKSDPVIAGKVVVEERLDRKLPPAPFDPDLIRQVLWNVIRNGFQALNGKGRLEIRTEALPGKVLVRVSDTGPGIAADRLEKVFLPFYTTKTKGTGLGLSISRNILVAHGGELSIESEPGRGTRVDISLPLSRQR
ncbi:MAG: PAS domain S-box protein [Elusimicrobia bacterium]|nr:PAS domain S-box protein [Elusimicrobiota bacterium]